MASFVVVAALAVASSLVTGHMVDDDQRSALEDRTARVRSSVADALGGISASMQALGVALQAGDAELTAAVRTLVVSGASTAAVVDLGTDPPQVVPGPSRAPDGLDPGAVAALRSLGPDGMFAPTGVLGEGDDRRVGFAQGSPVAPAGRAFYLEVPARPFDGATVRRVLGSVDGVDAALYAGPPSPATLLWATTPALPLAGEVRTARVPVGSGTWTVAVVATGALTSPLARAVPWILLGAGLVGAVLAATAVELATRRRDQALVLARLQREENLSILEAAGEAFISVDADGRIVRWNGLAEALFGWAAPEVLGRTVSEVLVPPVPAGGAGVARTLDELVGTGGGPVVHRRDEVDVLARDGRSFPAEAAVWSADGGSGRVANVVLHDITERRRAADELAAAHAEALDASRMKSEFLANMSHEIRTPMNGVIGMSGLLLRTGLAPEQREFAETIRTSAEALLAVVNDILDFSKIEAGMLALEPTELDPRTVAEEAAELLAEAAQAKGLELAVGTDADVPAVVVGDAGRLRQILLNLVSNAVKFTDEGEVVVRCSVVSREAGRVRLRYAVRDTGPGIDAEDQAAIFQSFTQVDGSSTRRHQGTGLGLAIASQLATLMGGEVGVESAVGEGSTFWCTIALDEVEGDVPARARLADLAGAHVLVVDDNQTNRVILTGQLASWGVRVGEADGGAAALAELAAARGAGDPYEVVVLDFHMPDLDGLVVAQRITDGDAPRPALVLLTSAAHPLGREALAQAGVVAALTKPVRHQLLHDRVAAALASSRTPPPPPAPPEPAPGSAPPAPGSPAGPAPRGRVLVAEDNPVNQRVAIRMLERLGWAVDVVGDGQEAVRALARAPYDLVLMDCQMPVLDGYGAAAAIRRGEAGARADVPIVAMTAAAMKGDEQRALDAGMDGYLVKPVRLEDLDALLARHAPAT